MAAEIPMTNGKTFICDDDDASWLSEHTWREKNGYAVTTINGKVAYAHVLIMAKSKRDKAIKNSN